MSLTKTDPTTEPVTRADLRDHLRIEAGEDDSLLDGYIKVARAAVEVFLRRQLVTATYVLKLDAWPSDDGVIRLPRPPLSSVTSVAYLDSDGDSQTLTATTDYTVDTSSEPGRIYLAYGASWPSVYDVRLPITITYVAGYSTIPQEFKHAVMMIAGDLYERRESRIEAVTIEDNPTWERLLWGDRFLGEVDL